MGGTTARRPLRSSTKPTEDTISKTDSPIVGRSSQGKTASVKSGKSDGKSREKSATGGARKKITKAKETTPDSEDPADEQQDDSEEDEDAFSEPESINSDALDDDPLPSKTTKRKRTSSSASPSKSKSRSSPKKSSSRKKLKTREEDEEEYEVPELDDGQEIVGVVVKAPTTGLVPPGQISKNTLNFLTQLKDPECNDREWFKLHEPVYRQAEKEWKDFIEAFTDVLVETDEQIPHLPPKDVTHRIYRDVRFSNDKTPYKTGFSASFSRSGRKGIFAGLKPGNESLIAAGTWCPSKNEINTIRNNLLRSSTRLRSIISSSEFVALFGKAKPHPKGERQNVWGMHDELKVAPKGIDKNHKDIDLLKCRSFAVAHKFTDSQVLRPDFKEELGRVATIMRPFVHCINDLMTIQDTGSDEEDEGQDDE